jgi:predicted RNA-binding protein with PIN domain
MNVIGSRPDGWWRDREGAMRRLVGELAGFAAEHEVTVVFDGRKLDLEPPNGVEVLFASRRGRNAADDDIAELVRQDAAPTELRVVTSDAELSRRVSELGAEVVGARSFRRSIG